jgi:hypothetical protein
VDTGQAPPAFIQLEVRLSTDLTELLGDALSKMIEGLR